MSQSISHFLDVNYESRKPFALKAERTLHRVTFNPSSASPGETLSVNIPKLDDDDVYVPKSIALWFNLTLNMGHVNNTVINNLGRNLVESMKISYGGETIQDLDHYDMYMTYSDLFKSVKERENMLREGISSSNMRKLRAGAGDKVTNDSREVTLSRIHGKRYRIPLSHELLDNHGVFNMGALNNDLIFQIKFPKSKDISVTTDTSKNYEYKLSDIELEYETIQSKSLYQDAAITYQIGKGFYYEHIHLYKQFEIIKDTTLINEQVNAPRRSLSGILMLFVETFTDGTRDSEKFVNPNITKIKINIKGKPNKIYSQGMLPTDIWDSVIKRYGLSDNITQKNFYTDKYAVWIDLRTYYDNLLHGAGILNSTKDGVSLTITRTATTNNITCFTYVVSDGVFEVENSNLKSIIY